MNENDIYNLLDRAYESEDENEIIELAERAYALDPNNPEALLLKADITEDDEARIPYLEKALKETRRYFQEEKLSGDNIMGDEMGLVYLGLLQRTAYTLFALERDEQSLKVVEELLSYDHEDQAMAKTLYYRILLEREEWNRVIAETMKETARGLAWAYARMIASFMLLDSKGANGKSFENTNKMLWDAVRMAPNVPFYMLGYIPDPVDESEDDIFHFSLLFENVWPASSQDMLNWFSKAAILFGLLTGRFGQESDDMEEILASLGGAEDYENLKLRLADADEEVILDELAAGGYPSSR